MPQLLDNTKGKKYLHWMNLSSLQVKNIHGVRKHILPINLGCSKDTCCRNKLKANKISFPASIAAII